MARMHSRDKGKSGSTKPFVKETPKWQTHTAKEVEALIVKLSKEKLTSAQIGTRLRDTYGIASVRATTGKKVVEIMTEKGISKQLPEPLLDAIKKFIAIRKHLDDNRQDKTAKRGLQLTQSKLNRLVKYYKRTSKLEADWKFNAGKAGLYLE